MDNCKEDKHTQVTCTIYIVHEHAHKMYMYALQNSLGPAAKYMYITCTLYVDIPN